MEWSNLDSVGASGGSVTLWRTNSMVLILCFKGPSYVAIKSIVKGVCTNFINIYASCKSSSRRKMWSSIEGRKRSSVGEEWCIWGDFSIVVIDEERIGKSIGVKIRDMADFNNFMEKMNLIDLPCVGNRYTWFSGNGTIISKLD